jgi:hypothetical protein
MTIYSQGIPDEPTFRNTPNQQGGEVKESINKFILNINKQADVLRSGVIGNIATSHLKAPSLAQKPDKTFNASTLNLLNLWSTRFVEEKSELLNKIFTSGQAAPENILILNKIREVKRLIEVDLNELNKEEIIASYLVDEDKDKAPIVYFKNQEEGLNFMKEQPDILYKGERKSYKVALLSNEYSSQLDPILAKSIQNYIAYIINLTKSESQEKASTYAQTSTFSNYRYTLTADRSPPVEVENKPLFFLNKRFMQTVLTTEAILQAKKEEEQKQAAEKKKADIERAEIKSEIRREEIKKEDIQFIEDRHSHVKGEMDAEEKKLLYPSPPPPQPRQP